jgi:hypothetical protein
MDDVCDVCGEGAEDCVCKYCDACDRRLDKCTCPDWDEDD